MRWSRGDANVARTVTLLERDTRAFLQQLLDGEGRRVLDALAADRGDGLSRRLWQGSRCWAGFGQARGGRSRYRRWRGRRCCGLNDGGGRRSSRGDRARSRRLRGAFELRRRHDHFGNSNRARCRGGRCAGCGLGRCAGLGRSGSRLIGVRLWRLRRFRWWRGRILRLPRHGNKHGAHEDHGKRQDWPMVACPGRRPAESHSCSQGSSDRYERGYRIATSADGHDTLCNRGIAARAEKAEWDDSRRSRHARSADRACGRADQPKMEMLSGGYWPVGELNSITRPSVRATAFEMPIASPTAMPWSVGKIAHGAFASVQSTHGD